jgi:hypothetical protein
MKNKNAILDKIKLSDEIKEIILKSPSCIFLNTRDEILSLAMSNQLHGEFEVAYDVPGHGRIVEATVTKCTNGLAVNYPTPYMRRRDPECMTVADPKQTDKIRYSDQFGVPFDSVRLETLTDSSSRILPSCFCFGRIRLRKQRGSNADQPMTMRDSYWRPGRSSGNGSGGIHP